MKRSRFTESRIFAILKGSDVGMPVKHVWRQRGISSATSYKWRSKDHGMEPSVMKRLKKMEAENRRLKQMFADLSLENHARRDLINRKS